jgi:hypothetical protein
MNRRVIRHRTLAAMAWCFSIAGVYHIAELFGPSLSTSSPAWRHALFAVVDVAVGLGLWRRPKGFLLVFSLLGIQQLYSHGRKALQIYQNSHQVDWLSILVLAAILLVWTLLWQERRPN